jgi:hypothetical protein
MARITSGITPDPQRFRAQRCKAEIAPPNGQRIANPVSAREPCGFLHFLTTADLLHATECCVLANGGQWVS